MRHLISGLLTSLFLAALAGPVGAQQDGQGDTNAVLVAPTILTIDIDRLFTLTEFGERISQAYTEGGVALQAENRRIADALRAEELALTAQRAEMAPDVFRVEAEAFDEKAQGIRRAQDAKERALEETLTQARDQFLEIARPILGQLMVDRGAFAILDRRSVVLSLGSIDVTEEAVQRINDAIGDGVDLVAPPDADPAQDTAPEN